MEKLIIFGIILIFSAIGKLIQKFNEQKEQEAIRNLRQLQPEKQRAQSELEAFLTRRDVVPESDVEVLSDGDFVPAARPVNPAPAPAHRPLPTEQRREQNRQKSVQQKQQKPNQARQQPQQQSRKNQKKAQQQPAKQPRAVQQSAKRPSGDGVRQHVEQHLTHLDTLVDDHVQSDIVDSVNSHMGAFAVPEESVRPKGTAAATAIVSALRSPNGVRQAILINEVLSRPRVLRR